MDGVPLKPDPTAAKNILSRLGFSELETAWVGDTSTDIETGKNLGAALSIGVLWGFRKRDELEGAGADVIAIPCNTAHYFYEGISADSSVPIINIVRQTVIFCKRIGIRRVGILATEGTVASGSYSEIFGMAGIECVVPDVDEQKIISDIIYGQIKKGIAPYMDGFRRVSEALVARGCERLVLGCTELSLLKRNGALDGRIYVDSLEVLAYSSIRACGKTPVGFDAELMSFRI